MQFTGYKSGCPMPVELLDHQFDKTKEIEKLLESKQLEKRVAELERQVKILQRNNELHEIPANFYVDENGFLRFR